MMILQPKTWSRPKGYANGIETKGRLVFVAGMVGWDEAQQFSSACMAEQTRKVLENIITVLAEAGAKAEHIVRMTWYITDKQEYQQKAKAIGAAYREVMGRHYPAMAMMQVVALMEDQAKVEIEATAVVPE
jgi:enamine deaminase RidA (YjgF/YER057c/UK114 family)